MNKSTSIISVLVISGPVGVGKSSVAISISTKLANRRVCNGIIDLDYLRAVLPSPKNDPFHMTLGYKNLSDVARNYREEGVTIIIIPNVIEEQRDIDQIYNSIPNAKITLVRLTGSINSIYEHLKTRETGDSLDWHLRRAEELSKQLEQSKLENLVINTDNKSIDLVADEILSMLKFIN